MLPQMRVLFYLLAFMVERSTGANVSTVPGASVHGGTQHGHRCDAMTVANAKWVARGRAQDGSRRGHHQVPMEVPEGRAPSE